jgi:hypothetical protein
MWPHFKNILSAAIREKTELIVSRCDPLFVGFTAKRTIPQRCPLALVGPHLRAAGSLAGAISAMLVGMGDRGVAPDEKSFLQYRERADDI